MTDTAVILAAGRGSRLDPGGTAEEFSKPLMEVGGRTLLRRTVDACRAAGARRIIAVTGFRAERVEAELRRISRGDVEAVYNRAWRRSNGLSLYACRHRIDGDFALAMADHVFDVSILTDLMALCAAPGTVTLAIDRNLAQVYDLADATKVALESGKITGISKSMTPFDAVDCGLFLCTPAIFPALEAAMGARGDCSLSEGMSVIAERGRFVPFDIGQRWWQDVDTPDMLARAAALLRRYEPAPIAVRRARLAAGT